MRLFTQFFEAVPWFLPGIVVWGLASLALAPRAARALRATPAVTYAVLLSLGFVVLATLTPTAVALASTDQPYLWCDLGRLTLPPLAELVSIGDTLRNIVLFVPLGMALAWLPRSRRVGTLIVLAYLLPFAIEALQLVLTPLGRGCQSADVIDNATGLTIGLVAGSVLRAIVRRQPDHRSRANMDHRTPHERTDEDDAETR